MLTATSLLLSACERRAAFGTNTQQEWCRQLILAAPTASREDTPQTQSEVAIVGDVIDTLCAR